MSITQSPAVVLSDVSYEWPDGTPLFGRINAAFGTGRSGLVGANGNGKTTLLRLIAGELRPGSGSVTVSGSVGYLPQRLPLRTDATVAGLLGVSEQLDALRAIEAGDADVRHFEAIGDAWDVEARSLAALDSAGLSGIGLDRRVGQLSGGESTLTGLAGLRLAGDDVALLDEPTNNLDRAARHRLYDAIISWPGALIVVSHDVALLDLMDDTAELRAGSIEVFGGTFSEYREHLEREQRAAEQAVRTAEQRVRTEQRQRVEGQTKLARRQRYAKTDYENKRKPKMVMRQRATEAQVSAGKLRGELDAKVEAAQGALEEQEGRVRQDLRIRVDLPDPDVPAGRRIAELRDGRGSSMLIQGPERVAIIGDNGIGKTRLLETLVHANARDCEDAEGTNAVAVPHTDRIGYLPQRLDGLDDTASVLDTVRASAPHRPPGALRSKLARLLFRADSVHRSVGDLSGGERFRVALAALLLAAPAHQLIVLDEPTNNLDLESVDALVDALSGYLGALLVVSHDDAFLDRLGIDVTLELGEDGLTVLGAG